LRLILIGAAGLARRRRLIFEIGEVTVAIKSSWNEGVKKRQKRHPTIVYKCDEYNTITLQLY
jgi:hypothetical protein